MKLVWPDTKQSYKVNSYLFNIFFTFIACVSKRGKKQDSFTLCTYGLMLTLSLTLFVTYYTTGMRDKWSRLQQLKNDALFGPGGAPPDTKAYRGGGGYGGYFNRAVTAPGGATTTGVNSTELSPLGSPVGFNLNAKFQNLSPRKRGLASAHAKRRGRPPKNVKHSHSSHSNLVSVGNTGSTGVGKENVTGGDVSMSDDTMEVDELVE